MFTSVRSVRATIGRMPTRAASSISAFTGKQNRNSVPSAFKILATAADAFIALLRRIVVEDLQLRRLIGDFAPHDELPGGARLHDAPLLADANDAGRQVFLAQGAAQREFGHVHQRIEIAP